MPSLKKVTSLYYGFQFFFSLLLWVPIFYDYQKRLGFSDQQIFSIQSVYYLAFCFLEIPTGLLADWFGYRLCLILGSVILVFSNLLPILFPSYLGFLAHFLSIALSRSLISGTSSAYIYEWMSRHGFSREYKVVEGRARALSLAGKVVFLSAVGFLMEWHFTLPYSLTAASALISVGFAVALPELPKLPQIDLNRGTLSPKKLKVLQSALVSSPLLGLVILQGVSVFVLTRICQVNLFQPLLHEKSFSVVTYGAVMSLMTIFEALGSGYPRFWTGLLRKRALLSDLNWVFFLTLIVAGSLYSISIAAPNRVGQVLTLTGLSVFSFAAGLAFPIQRQLLNDVIPKESGGSNFRATILSVESLVDRAACAAVAALLGPVVAGGGLDSFLRASVWVSVLGVLVLYAVAKSGPSRRLALRQK